MPPDVLMDSMRRFDRHNQQLLIDDTLDASSRAFQLATHVAHTSLRGAIMQIVREQEFASKTAATLVRRALAGYGAAAILMPYRKFARAVERSEEHTSELQSLMRISYAVFCLKKKKNKENNEQYHMKI